MNRYLESSRSAFRHQPIQYLIVDVGYPMTNFTLENCIAALQEVISLGCSIRGSNRISGFGVSAVGSHFTRIILLDNIKGNYGNFQDAINSMSEMVDENQVPADEFKTNLFAAITAAIEDFRVPFYGLILTTGLEEQLHKTQLSLNLNRGGVWQFSSQLQITLLTKKSGQKIQKYLEEIIQEVTTSKIKKIMVVELSCPLANPSSNEQYSQLPKVLGFVELTRVIASKPALEEYFKHWLLDCNTDHEHLRLIFSCGQMGKPNKSANLQESQDLVLKCDMCECIINPMSLPFGNRFIIQTDFLGLSLGGNTGKAQGNDLAIYELLVLARISNNGICESLLFGQPLRLYPTQCWRLEWAKLLENQQFFSELCKELTINEEFLLAQLKPHPHSGPVSGYFILVPGEGSLLLKAISPGEISLPEKSFKYENGELEEVPKDVHFKIISALKELVFYSEYDPKFWKSGLHSALSRNLMGSKKYLHHMHGRETKAPDPTKELRKMLKKETTKQKGVTPNVIIKEAISKTNY